MTAPEVVPNPEPHPDPRGSVPGRTSRTPPRATPNISGRRTPVPSQTVRSLRPVKRSR